MFFLFHRYGLRWALIDAGLAVDTEIDIDLCFAVFHGYGGSRTDVHTGLAGGTLLNINNCWHFCSSECT